GPVTTIGASRGNRRQTVEVRAPIGYGRRRTDAVELLDRARQAGVIERLTEKRRLRRILKEADTAAHDGPRNARRPIEAGDLRRRSIGPREAKAWTQVGAIGHTIVAHAEYALNVRIENGIGHKAIAVQPNAVLYLHVVRRPPCVAERKRADKLARPTRPRRELPRERGRLIGGEIGQRQIRERPEQIRRLVRHVRIAAQLGGELESML